MANILAVDDREDCRYILQKILSKGGHKAIVAVNGQKAMAQLVEHKFDLIISDILMPVMDGFQLCRQVKNQGNLRHIPFIFYTATYKDAKDEELARKLGADMFLHKPATSQEILDAVRQVLSRKANNVIPQQEKQEALLHLYNQRLINKLEQKLLALEKEVEERKIAETALKNSVEEKEVLLRELYHRTRNNMQVIISIMNLQMQHTQDNNTLQVLKETATKINAMALVHEKLYKAKDLSHIDLADYLADLANLFMKNYQPYRNVSLSKKLQPVSVTIDCATTCGLIVHELLCNSFKHAFADIPNGQVCIEMLATEPEIVIIVADNGIGLPNNFAISTCESLGLRSIYYLTTHHLRGQISLSHGQGTQWQIQFRRSIINDMDRECT